MSSIRKQVIVNGQAHYIEVNSSLDLEEVEVTGVEPNSGKVVQVSLSPLLKPSQKQYESPSPFTMAPMAPPPAWPGVGEQTRQVEPSSPAPMDMFSPPIPSTQISPPLTYHAVPSPPVGLFVGQSGADNANSPPSPYSLPSQSPPSFFNQTPPAEQPSLFTPTPAPLPAPSQGLEAIKRKGENEEVEDTLNGMYRH